MRYHTTADGDVPFTQDEEIQRDAEEAAAAIPTLDQYTVSVQNLLDTTAQAKHYDNIISCCSYAGAPNDFQAEGQAAIEWRGNVWATCYTIMAQVQAGTIPAPTIPELLAMLPVMVWP